MKTELKRRRATYSLHIAGVPIEVSRKAIKNMHLHVKAPDGGVTVSAPYAASDETIENFLHSRIGWVIKQIDKLRSLPRQAPRKYVSGETLYVWGRPFDLQVEHGARNALVLRGGSAVFTVREGISAEQRQRFVREWYRAKLKAEIERLLPSWESITGLKAADWQTKYMTTRWGTCNTRTRKLWFNLQLAKKPPECLEYIILHELLHLRERLHNRRFYAMMDRYMPNWREIKAILNGSGRRG